LHPGIDFSEWDKGDPARFLLKEAAGVIHGPERKPAGRGQARNDGVLPRDLWVGFLAIAAQHRQLRS
jgi:hypothetical protein